MTDDEKKKNAQKTKNRFEFLYTELLTHISMAK